MPEVKRQLAAIMFTDIVGYTSLMGQDEDSAFDVLRKNRELHRSAFEKYNGKFIKELGDGILASFDSVGDAVFCAREIQLQVAKDPDLSLRIGIHLGDVVFEDGDAHGDGVNIASRLTGVAKAGHILISEAVYKNISNKKDIQTRFIDKMNLKNVSAPLNVYLIGEGDYEKTSRFQKTRLLTGGLFFMIIILLSALVLVLTKLDKNAYDQEKNVSKLSIRLDHQPEDIAISPDGRYIVYQLKEIGKPLFLRKMDESVSVPLEETESGAAPFFSYDGKSIGFFKINSLYKTSIANSKPIKLAEGLVFASGAYWMDNDTIFLSYNNGSVIGKIPSSGGIVQNIPTQGQSIGTLSGFGNQELLLATDEKFNIVTISQETGKKNIILEGGGWKVKYLEPGYLVHALPGRLYVTAFDKTTLKTSGPPTPIISPLKSNILGRSATYDISSNGLLVYSPAPPDDNVYFLLTNMKGEKVDSLNLPPNFYGSFSLSPDRRKLAFGLEGPESQIWIYDLESKFSSKITSQGRCHHPIWSPDGQWVTYSSLNEDKWEIYRQNLNTTSEREQLTQNGSLKIPGSWSPDGKLLTFYELTDDGGYDMHLLSLESGEISKPFMNTSVSDNQPRFSPNGKFVCYYSAISGNAEIYVEPYPPTGKRWQISQTPGVDPIWSADGSKIYYRTADAANRQIFYRVEVTTTDPFTFGNTEVLFTEKSFIDVFDRSFDVLAKDEQLLVLESVASGESYNYLEVILNWPEELKQLVPRE